mgnify:CR=1 FL=1
MIIYQAFKSISLAAFLVVSSCEDKNDSVDNSPISDQVINVTTTNVNIDNIYYNLTSQSQVSVDDVWDIGIVKDTENYNMPSFVPGSVDIAVYEMLNFNSVVDLPVTFESDLISDHSLFSYENIYEVLSYDMNVHKVSVTNPDYVYLIKSGDNAFKLQFDEYISGITIFKYGRIGH